MTDYLELALRQEEREELSELLPPSEQLEETCFHGRYLLRKERERTEESIGQTEREENRLRTAGTGGLFFWADTAEEHRQEENGQDIGATEQSVLERLFGEMSVLRVENEERRTATASERTAERADRAESVAARDDGFASDGRERTGSLWAELAGRESLTEDEEIPNRTEGEYGAWIEEERDRSVWSERFTEVLEGKRRGTGYGTETRRRDTPLRERSEQRAAEKELAERSLDGTEEGTLQRLMDGERRSVTVERLLRQVERSRHSSAVTEGGHRAEDTFEGERDGVPEERWSLTRLDRAVERDARRYGGAVSLL